MNIVFADRLDYNLGWAYQSSETILDLFGTKKRVEVFRDPYRLNKECFREVERFNQGWKTTTLKIALWVGTLFTFPVVALTYKAVVRLTRRHQLHQIYLNTQYIHPNVQALNNQSKNLINLGFSDMERAFDFILNCKDQLRALDLTCFDEKLSDKHLIIVGKIKGLESLNIASCENLTDRGIQALASLSKLRELDMEECEQVTDEGIKTLGKLTNLNKLSLAWCDQLTDKGLQALSACRNLKSLTISHNQHFTDKGLNVLHNFKDLRSLDVSGCPGITDKATQMISKVSSLEKLNIGATKLTDGGVYPLRYLSKLRKLNLYNCAALTNQVHQHLALFDNLQSTTLWGCHQVQLH